MATPKLALIPTGYKAGKLYSVLPESGVGDFTVVRATEATRVNEAGLIETMGANVPRLDYSGGGCPVLLTEPQRTNNVLYSQEADNAYWLKSNCTITPNTSISPDGTVNADTLTSTAADSVLYRTSLTTGSLSFFAKNINLTSGNFKIQVDGVGSANWDKNGNLVSVSGGTASNGLNYGNGWFRFSYNVLSGSVVNYGITNSTGSESILVYGLQNEPSASYPTSLIKTSGSAVTRNGDQVNGAGDASTFNDSEGVLMAEISSFVEADNYRIISLNAGNSTDSIFIGLRNDTGNVYMYMPLDATSYISNVNTTNKFTKIALKYKTNDVSFFINGFKVFTDNTVTLPTGLNQLDLDYGNPSGSYPFYGNTSQVQYFDSALTDSELEKLTSWTSFIEMAQALNYNII
tara:strand:- start:766 stop:1977 length:1212 start_codon:yes stop_codon:yes gene_type:complete